MKPVEIVYLDIDGVLNQMPYDALNKVLGTNIVRYPLPGNYDIVKACNKACLDKGIKHVYSPEEFWSKLDREFWANIHPSPECDWLPELCGQVVGRKNVFLLSTPIHNPDCVAGKMEWIHKNLPSWLHRQFIFTPHKWVCSKPGTLLIDDYDKNIQLFETYGGQTILVPRPWNS
jgi:5'(3')-deoxyribonucleotidase